MFNFKSLYRRVANLFSTKKPDLLIKKPIYTRLSRKSQQSQT